VRRGKSALSWQPVVDGDGVSYHNLLTTRALTRKVYNDFDCPYGPLHAVPVVWHREGESWFGRRAWCQARKPPVKLQPSSRGCFKMTRAHAMLMQCNAMEHSEQDGDGPDRKSCGCVQS